MAGRQSNLFEDGEVTGYNPDQNGDYRTIDDLQYDYNHSIAKLVDVIVALSNNEDKEFFILYGGQVTDSGSSQVDIAAGVAIGKNENGDVRICEIPALTNVDVPSGWNDNRQIWCVGYHEWSLNSATRNHATTGESYHPYLDDGYKGQDDTDDLFVDSDPNSGSENVLCWGSFQISGGGVFTSLDSGERTRHYGISVEDANVNGDLSVTGDASVTVDLDCGGVITGDTINEKTADAGVTIEGLKFEDDTIDDVNFEDILQTNIKKFTIATGKSVTAGEVVEYINNQIQKGIGESDAVYGSAVTFNSAASFYARSTLVSENKVAIFFRDNGDSGYGKLIVCTISGTVPSFGSAVTVVATSVADHLSICTIGEDKVALSWQDSTAASFCSTIVATISGTVPSFGSKQVASTGISGETFICSIDEDKFLVGWRNSSASHAGESRVGTVSGTTITLGSMVVYEAGYAGFSHAVCVAPNKVVIVFFDSDTSVTTCVVGEINGTSVGYGSQQDITTNNGFPITLTAIDIDRFAFIYKDTSDSNYGKVGIGQVTGFTVTFGSILTYSAATVERSWITTLSRNKFIIVFEDNNDSGYAKTIVGLATGTLLELSDSVTVLSSSSDYFCITAISSTKVIISLTDLGVSNYGKSIVGDVPFTLGIAQESGGSEENIYVALPGAISYSHAGLTPDSEYFSDDGDLIFFSPIIMLGQAFSKMGKKYIGRALSATELLIDRNLK